MSTSEKLKFDSRWFEKNDPEEKRLRRKRRLGKVIAVVVLGTCGIATGVAVNAQDNQQLADNSSASVDVISPALDKHDNDNAIVFMDGFNTPNADWITEDLGPIVQHIDDGQTWSVNYGDAPLSPHHIAADIINLAEKRDVHSVDLVGNSAGGDDDAEIQQIIHEDSTLTTPLEVMISSPSALSDVRSDVYGNTARNFVTWMDSNWYSRWAEYSTPVQFAGEMMFYHPPQYNLFDSIGTVAKRMGSGQTPGGWLMIDQLLAVQRSHVRQQLSSAGKQSTGVKPVIVYMGTGKGGYDAIVDDHKAGDEIQKYSNKAGLDFVKYNVPGAVHGDVAATLPGYEKAFQTIKPELVQDMQIQLELSTAALRQYVAQHADVDPDYQH